MIAGFAGHAGKEVSMVGMGFRRIALAQGLLDGAIDREAGQAAQPSRVWTPAGHAESPHSAGGEAPDRGCANITDRGGFHFAR
jgi:hypothetical protein